MVDDPILLQETNNTVVWLRPHEIIAKVGTWAHSEEALRREHDVATILAAAGAPIALPVRDAEPVRDEHSGFLVTLWAAARARRSTRALAGRRRRSAPQTP